MNGFIFETELLIDFHGLNEEIPVDIYYDSDGDRIEIQRIVFPQDDEVEAPDWLYVLASNHESLNEDMREFALATMNDGVDYDDE